MISDTHDKYGSRIAQPDQPPVRIRLQWYGDGEARAEAAEARAEAAEAELESALAVVDLYQQRMFAAEAEVAARAALKAQAGQWRPVTEPPGKIGERYIINIAYDDGPPLVTAGYYTLDRKWIDDDFSGDTISGITHWQPLPLPPQEAE